MLTSRSAEEIFVRWLVSLPAEADPGLAASAALARIAGEADAGEVGRLRMLLEETSRWTAPALASLARVQRPRRPS
jgi:hypothetical protein